MHNGHVLPSLKELPNNVDALKKLVIEYAGKAINFEQRLTLALQELYGKKSEAHIKEDARQSSLFNEAETLADESEKNKIEIKSHRRRKRGRKKISDELPRKEIIIDIPEKEKSSDCCGKKAALIGQEVSERIEYIQPSVYVKRTVRLKYAFPDCDCSNSDVDKPIKIAPAPPVFIKGSIITENYLATILVSKFCDHIPFYRQEQIYGRLDIILNRNTMSNLLIATAKRLNEINGLLWEELLNGPVILIDETPLIVMREPGKRNSQKSYMFIIRGGLLDKPVILFYYSKTRSAQFLNDYLREYKGVVLTDGWPSYNVLCKGLNIKHAGCWAHVRRKYVEYMRAAKVSVTEVRPLYLIGRLYRLEGLAKNFSLEKIKYLRKKWSGKYINKLKDYISTHLIELPEDSLAREAMEYTFKEWDKLIVYLDNPAVPIDNNADERVVKAFATGRKNWLFSGSPRGADSSALMYSLVQTSVANGLNPQKYLTNLFENFPLIKKTGELIDLLPNRINPDLL